MKQKLFYLFIILFFISFGVSYTQDKNEGKVTDIIGIKKREDLQFSPFKSWFFSNYQAHRLDEEKIKKLRPLMKDIELKLFMGTWCSDSRIQVPAIYKILDSIGFDEKKMVLIAMSEYKETPQGYEKGLEITNVPTLIFYRKGKEINRIVEFPIRSLEVDMYTILTENSYKHAYAQE